MEELIRQDILKYIKLSDEEFKQYYNLLQFQNFKKKTYLLSAGMVCHNAFFIMKGCVRYFTVLDGEEHTGQFFFEGTWYSDYESFLFNRPSAQSIQAIENTTVAMLSKENLEILFQDIPKFERFGRLMAENAFMGLRQRTESLTQLSAIERYNLLVKNRPKVLQRVPQKYIAGYLGIRPQSLSRIRKKIS